MRESDLDYANAFGRAGHIVIYRIAVTRKTYGLYMGYKPLTKQAPNDACFRERKLLCLILRNTP